MTAERTVMVLCEECGGEGKIFTSRYGGNDPDVWPIGKCPVCDGTCFVDVPSEVATLEDIETAARLDPTPIEALAAEGG